MAGTADHPIIITPHGGHVRISRNGQTIVTTDRALDLKEAHYPMVLYVPRDDADMTLLTANPKTTHCPYKGDASYFDLDGAPGAVWSYETPKGDVGEIADYLAFYPDTVKIEG